MKILGLAFGATHKIFIGVFCRFSLRILKKIYQRRLGILMSAAFLCKLHILEREKRTMFIRRLYLQRIRLMLEYYYGRQAADCRLISEHFQQPEMLCTLCKRRHFQITKGEGI